MAGLKATEGGGKADQHPEKRRKALFEAYTERELVTMREEQPGLKLSQMKERIFEMWKKVSACRPTARCLCRLTWA